MNQEVNRPQRTGTATRGVITVAFGSDRYIRMARNLALSVRQNWPGVAIALVTDSSATELMREFDHVIPMDEAIGRSLLQKLNLDRYSPFDETLFLDADCLVVRSMSFVWPMFAESQFAVVGSEAYSGEWFGAEIADVREALGIRGPVPKFNGGLMYWKKGEPGNQVFRTARELAVKYGTLGFESFRTDLPQADEPLISLGMALNGHSPIDDGGSSMSTPIGIRGRMSIDVRRGFCVFLKHSTRVAPAAPHFCGPFARGPYYLRETFKLRALNRGRQSSFLAAMADFLFAPATLLDHAVVWNALQRTRHSLKKLRSRHAS